MFLEVNPFAESTWRNHPAPCDVSEFNRELARVCGTHLNSAPLVRLQWAPDHRRMQLGQMRPVYVDTRIPTRRVLRGLCYLMRKEGEPDAVIPEARLGEFGPDWLALPVPDYEVVTISPQRWALQQYFPPERLGESPAQWEARRYRKFTPPETGVEVFGDDIGAFPSGGEYRHLLFVQSPEVSDVYDPDGTYRPPGRDVLEMAGALLTLRERHHDPRPLERRIADDYAAADAADEAYREQTLDDLDQALKPHEYIINGDPSPYPIVTPTKNSRRTRHGVATAK